MKPLHFKLIILKTVLMTLCIYLKDGTKCSLSTLHCNEVGTQHYYLYFTHQRNETETNYITSSILHRIAVKKERKPRTLVLSNFILLPSKWQTSGIRGKWRKIRKTFSGFHCALFWGGKKQSKQAAVFNCWVKCCDYLLGYLFYEKYKRPAYP